MDAIEFIREEIRMCASYQDCIGCPLSDTAYCSVSPKKRLQEEAGEIVRRVEQWSAAHPCKTRQNVFLEQYPQAEIDTLGYLTLCPKRISVDCRIRYGNCTNRICSDCRKEFWSQEIE